jgi:hypothetical protein
VPDVSRRPAAVDIPVDDLKRNGPPIPPGVPLAGAYLVRFAGGEHYAGQTDNIILRIGSHRRTWDDMAAITFWPGANLEPALPATGSGRPRVARPGPPLRKVDRDDPGIDPVLDRMRWADEYIFTDHTQRPRERPDQRERTRPLFDRLSGHPDFDRIAGLAGRYLRLFVPAPAATEVDNWVITSLPSTIKTRFWHRLICLSINNVEALTIGTQFDGTGWTTVGFMSANPSEQPPDVLLSPGVARHGVFLAPAWYETVGPVYQVGFDNLDGMQAALEDDEILDLIGAVAMRLMKRGRGLYGRFHDYNLADVILDRAR